jgi:hypothetical protein
VDPPGEPLKSPVNPVFQMVEPTGTGTGDLHIANVGTLQSLEGAWVCHQMKPVVGTNLTWVGLACEGVGEGA